MEACKNFDLIRLMSPYGGATRVLAKVRSAVETASTEDGTVAVLSKNVAGGGVNANAFTQIYLITPGGEHKEVFSRRNLVFFGEIPHARGYDTAIYTVRTSGAGRKLASSRFEFAGLPQWMLRP